MPQLIDIQLIEAIQKTGFAPTCAKLNLFEPLPFEKMYPYKKARLVDCDGDISKRWYIEFYAWDVQQDKLLRKRFYEINNLDTIKDRRAYARRIIGEINELLKDGYHFDLNKVPEEIVTEEKRGYSLNEAVDHALEIKKPSIRSTSYPSYKSSVELFKFWTAKNRISQLDVVLFDKLRAVYFDDYLAVQCGFAAKTINGHISYLKSLFQLLVDREILASNPFRSIKKHKESASRKNLAFSPEQIVKMKDILEEKDPLLWLFIQFIYYCYLRPNEIRQLKHSYIQLGEKQIFIPAHISKNGKDGYVTIPDTFYQELMQSKEFGLGQEYVFQSKRSKSPVSKNMMGTRFHNLVKGLNLSQDYTLYSWKHSGVVAAYNAGVDIKTIQRQCRHHSLELTDIYLKSLGLGVSQAMNRIPGL